MRDYLNIFKRWINPIKLNRYFFANLKDFFRAVMRWPRQLWQRATRGYCTEDLFNLDLYFLSLFYSALLDFADMDESFPQEFEELSEWQKVVRDIAFKFYEADENNEVFKNPYPLAADMTEEARKKWREREYEIRKLRMESFDMGMEQFKKYFWHLWD